MKAKKTLMVVVAMVLVAVVSVAMTLAFLSDQSEEVVNTFTVGNIQIRLEEHDDGTAAGNVVPGRENIKMLPGADIPKDPFVTVEANSEDCYVYVRVLSYMSLGMNTDGSASGSAIELDYDENWEFVGRDVNSEDMGLINRLYRYKGTDPNTNGVIKFSTDETVLEPIFTSVHVKDNLSFEDLNKLMSGDKNKIVIQAYAYQAEGVSVDDANSAAKNWAHVA